jgi:hypothetical protein
MDLDSMASRWIARSRCRWVALILPAALVTLSMATAVPAQATPNVAKAWGFNTEGQLGDGTNEGPGHCSPEAKACSTVPVAVKELNGVAALAGGTGHSLARLAGSGRVMAWGGNEAGQLGNGTTTRLSDEPVAVCAVGTVGACPSGPYLEGVTAIAAGGDDSLAVRSDGTVVAWGRSQGSDVPVVVAGLSRVTAIAAGTGFFLALIEGGTVMAWGANSAGQLGNGSTEFSATPVAVSGLEKVTAVAAGSRHSLALVRGGTVMAWGANSAGQLGNETTKSSSVPVAVSGLENVTAIAAGGGFSLALLSNHTVKAWGINDTGELGDGTSIGPEMCGAAPFSTACSDKPIPVSGLTEVTAISAGAEHGLALLSNRSVKSWGHNVFGQLGDGTSAGPEGCGISGSCSTTPVAVCAEGPEAPCDLPGTVLTNVTGISAGQSHSLAMVQPPPPPGLPELGRCVKAGTPKTGEFKGPKCIAKNAKHEGEYNWLPGPGQKPGAKTRLLGLTLETVTKQKINCAFAFLEEGAVTSGKELKFKKVTMQGCIMASGLRCFSNPGESGTIESTTPLNGEIGFIPGSKNAASPWVGLDLKPESELSKTLIEFSCGEPNAAPIYQVALEGSVIGRVKPLDKMVENNQFALFYTQSAGVQIPTAFKEGVEDVLTQVTTPILNPPAKKTEQVGLAAPAEVALEESLEIKNKV